MTSTKDFAGHPGGTCGLSRAEANPGGKEDRKRGEPLPGFCCWHFIPVLFGRRSPYITLWSALPALRRQKSLCTIGIGIEYLLRISTCIIPA
jgi:hypothetical protein